MTVTTLTPPAPPTRGFVLSVDLPAGDDLDQAELLRSVATLAELAGEWFPRSRSRAVLTSDGRPARHVPAPRAFRDRLDALGEHADVEIDPATRTVRVAGREVELTGQEIALLVHLARAGDRTVTREELLDVAWHGQLDPATRTVDVHVRRLRAKTGIPDLVATVWGVGYRIDPQYHVRVAA